MNARAEVNEKTEATAVPAQDPLPQAPLAAASRPRRRVGRYLLMVVVPAALVAGGGYYWVTGGRFQETENANLRQARVTITSEAAGRVTSVTVGDNAVVHAGDVLFTVEEEPYRIALAQADAALAAARLNVEGLRAAYGQATAQLRSASDEVAYLRSELQRQEALSGKGIATQAALDEARRNLTKAEDQERIAQQAVAGALAALSGDAAIPTDSHPTVQAALAARDKAAYTLAQATVRAPADGTVSQAASFKLGQFVAAGSPLFTLVETGDSWVEANFKETQLTNMRVGQKAEVVLDTFPDRPLEATVESIGAGTGAEFSLLPAQNATGNWVKVTQRIPVRLRLEDEQLAPMLRTGMSASVSVDTEVSRGFGSLVGDAFAGDRQ